MRTRLATAAAGALLWAGLVPGGAEAAARGAPPPPVALFGSAGTLTDPPVRLPAWERALAAMAEETPAYDACARRGGGACPSAEAAAWLGFLEGLRGAPRLELLRAVNAYANRLPYRSDRENHGRRDHWAAPLEFLARSGDCEDYAIAKYVSLRRLGVPAAELRLVVVQDVARDTPHAVLAAAAGGRWYVLDNLSERVLPQERVTRYLPYYAVNEEGRWTHPPPEAVLAGRGQDAGPTPAAEAQAGD